MSEAIVFTSGKGGVGKTTTIANIGVGLSLLDKKVIMLDTDMGLRNLDVVMGLENQINYNLLDLLEHKCTLKQAVIKDRRFTNLALIPGALKTTNLQKYISNFQILVNQLKQEYDFVLIDCPAGIDTGFQFAISAADSAFLVTTPHISAIRDAGRTIYTLDSYQLTNIHLLINEYESRMVKRHEMLSKKDIEDILELECYGMIPSDKKVIISQNQGLPVITYSSKIAEAYIKICKRIVKSGLSAFDRKEYLYEAL